MSVPSQPIGTLLDRAAGYAPCSVGELLASSGGVLVIAPHPDDETLGCGLAIRAALSAGRDVGVLLLTGGGASHPGSQTYPTDRLKALRRDEFIAALDALSNDLPAGAGRLDYRLLDLPDGAVNATGNAAREAIRRAEDFADELNARTLWVTWAGDPHVDHQAASSLADQLVSNRKALRCDYAVWGRFGAAGARLGDERIVRFDAPAHRTAKRAAMIAYRSQLTPMIVDDPEGFVMPPALVEHFAATPEIFVIAA